MPELDPGIMAPGLEPVIAVLGGDRVQRDQQVRPASRGAQLPAAVAAGRPVLAGGGERESRPRGAAGLAGRITSVRRTGSMPFRRLLAVLGFGPGAAVPDGVPVLVGHGDAPGRLGVLGGRGGQVAGQGRVDRADPGDLPGPAGLVLHGGQRHRQGHLPGEPGGHRPGRGPARAAASRARAAASRRPGRRQPPPGPPSRGSCRPAPSCPPGFPGEAGNPGPAASPGKRGRGARPYRRQARPP